MVPHPLESFLLLISRQPLATTAVLAGVWALALRSPAVRGELPRLERNTRPVILTAAVLVLAGFAAFGVWYAEQPGFACEVEPQVATVSALMNDGAPVYHTVDAAERYSILYGPSLYLATGSLLNVFGNSIPVAKSGAAAALILSLPMLFLALRRHVKAGTALTLTAAGALLYWTQGTSAFVLRPDPYLILGVTTGLWSAGLPRRAWAVALTAVCLAFVVNLKIHAVLYLLPVLALLDLRHGWRAALTALPVGLTLALAPFAFHPGIDPYLYAQWIGVTLHHGLDWDIMPQLLRRESFYTLPVLIPLLLGGRVSRRTRLTRELALVWLVSNASVLILATKPGAGLVHLLPLIPVNLVYGARLWAALPDRAARWRGPVGHWGRGAALAFLVVAMVSGSVVGYRSGRMAEELMAHSRDLAADIHAILDAQDGRTVGMGYGGEGPNFLVTYLRPLLAFAHQPVILDAIALMDAERADLELSAKTIAALDQGVIDVWLIPRGQEPFDKKNWYPPHHPIFPDEYRERFRANYSLESRSRFFDLWSWQGVQQARRGDGGGPSAP